ncbi:hypothetical protein SEMRO_349_G123360.1 [Seminavis robusta]|uniref:Uncharacterized protein n=1 Tax=Seminavis robusta TaxID=568900 RepID=A0A9N8DTX3_9STRA|nr:hypothetical protein SEMRO_349_G123360.1 [Seminavis robusta]|eukprot:Sro349_g123360.1 n/a (146) ;mRNA; r:10063-10500
MPAPHVIPVLQCTDRRTHEYVHENDSCNSSQRRGHDNLCVCQHRVRGGIARVWGNDENLIEVGFATKRTTTLRPEETQEEAVAPVESLQQDIADCDSLVSEDDRDPAVDDAVGAIVSQRIVRGATDRTTSVRSGRPILGSRSGDR